MNAELTIAALTCVALAAGHATAGRWVLPSLTKERLPRTPFGPPSVSVGMVRFTWHIVTVVLVAFAALLMSLAWAGAADPKTLLLRWFAAFWVVATATAFWVARRRPSSLLRPPLPLLFMVIAVMCWMAST